MLTGYTKVVRLTAGDDFDFDGTFPRVPAGQRLVKAWLTIKHDPSDADAAAVYQSVITMTPDASGNAILLDGSENVRNGYGKAELHWLLPRATTALFPVGPDLYYDVQVRSSAGLEATVERGVFRVFAQITLAT
jgi:hypothetical protein